MRTLVIIIVSVLALVSCSKRNDEFKFAGGWVIEKVEMVRYSGGEKVWDTLITEDAGWFGLQNATGGNGNAKVGINYPTTTGLHRQYDAEWELDEHTGERLVIQGVKLTRKKNGRGETWSFTQSGGSGTSYFRETLFVKHQ